MRFGWCSRSLRRKHFSSIRRPCWWCRYKFHAALERFPCGWSVFRISQQRLTWETHIAHALQIARQWQAVFFDEIARSGLYAGVYVALAFCWFESRAGSESLWCSGGWKSGTSAQVVGRWYCQVVLFLFFRLAELAGRAVTMLVVWITAAVGTGIKQNNLVTQNLILQITLWFSECLLLLTFLLWVGGFWFCVLDCFEIKGVLLSMCLIVCFLQFSLVLNLLALGAH